MSQEPSRPAYPVPTAADLAERATTFQDDATPLAKATEHSLLVREGTRLRPLTLSMPKPLAPVAAPATWAEAVGLSVAGAMSCPQRAARSDGHVEDVLIGLHHLVANLQRGFESDR